MVAASPHVDQRERVDDDRRVRILVRSPALVVAWLVGAFVAAASAAPIAVRHAEAPSHAFLVLGDLAGKTLADGELVQWQEKGALANRLVFRFRDGSLYDETVRFSTRSVFRVLAYRLVQRGPSFAEASEVEFARGGRYTARTRAAGGDEKRDAGTVELPDDVSNGMTSTLLKNLAAGARASVHMMAFTPSPTLLEATLVPEGSDAFWVAGRELAATRFVVTPKVVGVKGVVATLVGKQPEAIRFWLSAGRVPTFVKFEGPMYLGGPPWRVELAAIRWKR